MEEGSRQSFFRFQSITTYKSLRTIFTGMSVQDILEKKTKQLELPIPLELCMRKQAQEAKANNNISQSSSRRRCWSREVFKKIKKKILVKIKLKKKGAKSPTLVVHESDGNVEI